MGKPIRRTITIILTETWTFVWAKTEDAPEQTITVEQTTAKEEPDAPLPLPISTTDPVTPSEPDPPTSQPGDVTPATNRKRKRSRRRRSPGKQSGM